MGNSYSASMLAGPLIMFVFILMIFKHISKTSKSTASVRTIHLNLCKSESLANLPPRLLFMVRDLVFTCVFISFYLAFALELT